NHLDVCCAADWDEFRKTLNDADDNGLQECHEKYFADLKKMSNVEQGMSNVQGRSLGHSAFCIRCSILRASFRAYSSLQNSHRFPWPRPKERRRHPGFRRKSQLY